MRYAYGILLGFILTGVIFLGSAAIKIVGIAAENEAQLASIWSLYLVWFVISIVILVAPLIVAFIAYREEFKQILLYEVGSVSLFTPFWLGIATEISGDPFTSLLRNGIQDGLPYFDSQGVVRGLRIGPIIVIPALIAMLVFGLFILRPAFLKRFVGDSDIAELSKLREDAESSPDIGADAITIEPPESDEDSIAEMKSTLDEIGVSSDVVDKLLDSGFGNITEFMGTSAEQVSAQTGLEASEMQKLQIKLQKHIWFSGI